MASPVSNDDVSPAKEAPHKARAANGTKMEAPLVVESQPGVARARATLEPLDNCDLMRRVDQNVDVLAPEGLHLTEAPTNETKTPPSECSTFTVTVSKDATASGFEWEVFKGMLLVSKLGPMVVWNAAQAHSLEKVREGDRILSVNGASGDAATLLAEIRKNRELRLDVRHTKSIVVRFKRNSRPLGAHLVAGQTKTGLLKIQGIAGRGVFADWNEANPSEEVSDGDRVQRVNGVSGNGREMLEELERSEQVELVVAHPF